MSTTTTTAPSRNGNRISVETPENPCPECGRRRGLNNRCYDCRPWNRHGRPRGSAPTPAPEERPARSVCPQCGAWKSAHHRWCAPCDARVLDAARRLQESAPTVPAASPPPPPSGDPEFRVMASVVEALDRLDEGARRRVLAYVAARVSAAGNAGEGGGS